MAPPHQTARGGFFRLIFAVFGGTENGSFPREGRPHPEIVEALLKHPCSADHSIGLTTPRLDEYTDMERHLLAHDVWNILKELTMILGRQLFANECMRATNVWQRKIAKRYFWGSGEGSAEGSQEERAERERNRGS